MRFQVRNRLESCPPDSRPSSECGSRSKVRAPILVDPHSGLPKSVAQGPLPSGCKISMKGKRPWTQPDWLSRVPCLTEDGTHRGIAPSPPEAAGPSRREQLNVQAAAQPSSPCQRRGQAARTRPSSQGSAPRAFAAAKHPQEHAGFCGPTASHFDAQHHQLCAAVCARQLRTIHKLEHAPPRHAVSSTNLLDTTGIPSTLFGHPIKKKALQ